MSENRRGNLFDSHCRSCNNNVIMHVHAYACMYCQVYVWPLVHISQMWTVWITVLVAFNRYVAICMPFQAIRVSTMRQARLQVLVSAVGIIVYNIPRFLEHRLQYYSEVTQSQVNESHHNCLLLFMKFILICFLTCECCHLCSEINIFTAQRCL